MSLLASHLEHITYCCEGIDGLQFGPPKIFTNALLANHDITTLIRDTEAHERALFSVPPPPPPPASSQNPDPKPTTRRQTVFNVVSGDVTTGASSGPGRVPRRHTAVAAVLGGHLHAQITCPPSATATSKASAGDIDMEILLRGAEKLCSVYALPGALERIPVLRARHSQLQNTLAYYEAKVAEQTVALERMNRDHWMDEGDEEAANEHGDAEGAMFTEEALHQQEENVREIDKKKKELQERLSMMERDLAGL